MVRDTDGQKRQWVGVTVVATFLLLYATAWTSLAAYYDSQQAAWQTLRVPADERTFSDLRFLLEYVDCAKRDNPYTISGCDWRGRPFNYPSIWLSIGHLGASVHYTDVIGASIATIFVSSVLIVFRRSTLWAAIAGGLCIISPAMMLGIERGNIDLLIFSILAGCSIVVGKKYRVGEIVLATGILLAACLKLYPIAAVVCFLRRRRESLALGIAVLAVFAVWVSFIWDELYYIRHNTPMFAWRSYGYKTAVISLVKKFIDPILRPTELQPAIPPLWDLATKAVLLMACTASIAIAFRAKLRWISERGAQTETQYQFLIGAAIYVFTFTLGTNFSYRLIFLLFCLQQLDLWINSVDRQMPSRWFAATLMVGVVMICWIRPDYALSKQNVALEIVSWFLFVAFSVVLADMLIAFVQTFRWLDIKRFRRTRC